MSIVGFGRVSYVPPPSNDDFANAMVISGSSGSTSPENVNAATVEPGEPAGSCLGNGIHQSVWFTWTAPANGTATISTHNSVATDSNGGPNIPPTGPPYLGPSLDTTLAVWTGGSLGTLVQVACNDDDPSGLWGYNSLVTFTAVMGTVYMIQVGTFDQPNLGLVVLNWSV